MFTETAPMPSLTAERVAVLQQLGGTAGTMWTYGAYDAATGKQSLEWATTAWRRQATGLRTSEGNTWCQAAGVVAVRAQSTAARANHVLVLLDDAA
jgi:hypothetical protein